jgi:3-oxoacyl-[acyl-carrier protein] reductase
MAYPLADYDFKGCVAVVTGGNGGIGAAIADRLAGCGATVEIWDMVKGDDPDMPMNSSMSRIRMPRSRP